MMQQYHLSVDSLTNNFLETLKEQYPHAQLDIRVETTTTFEGLTEKEFWKIIACFDWSDSENDKSVIEKAIQVLSEKPVRFIYEFQDILSEKLFALDTLAHAENTGDNAWEGGNADFSADEFLYARCCVVANGKDFYKKVLHQPDLMPKDLTFESLLSLASKSYLKTKMEPNI